jgi:aspartate dehydrogenase
MTSAQRPSELRVALAGFGTIGGVLAARLDQGIPDLRLVAVSARDPDRARRRMALARPVPVLPLAELCVHADVVVECAPAAVFRAVAAPTIEAGRIFMPAASASFSSMTI